MEPIAALLDGLVRDAGEPRRTVVDPYASILHENAGYLVEDARRDVLYARIVALAPDAQALLAPDRAELLAIARDGGMRPEERAERWRAIAEITLGEADGDPPRVCRAAASRQDDLPPRRAGVPAVSRAHDVPEQPRARPEVAHRRISRSGRKAQSVLEHVDEILRLPSPAPKPQSLACDGGTLWMGSRETCRLYAIDRARWTARDEAVAPGVPWGMTVVGDELRVIHGEGEDDDRVVKRFIPGRGFQKHGAFRAPDGTGSQLGWDGDVLYISQWYKKRVLGVDAQGGVLSSVDVPHGVCGQVVVDGRFYLVTTEDEENGPYWLTRLDARGDAGAVEPIAEDLAIIPFPARALAFDGEHFWTNHREADQIVAFARPDG